AHPGGNGRPSSRPGDRPASGPRPAHGGRRSLIPSSTPAVHAFTARPLAVLSCALLLGVFLGSYVAYFPVSIASLVVLVLGGVLWLSLVGRCSPGFGCLVFGVLLSGLASAALAQMKAEPPAWIVAVGAQKVDVIGVVAEPVRFGPDRAVVLVSVQRLVLQNKTVPVGGRIRLTVRGSVPPLVVGDVIEFTTRLHPPRGLWNPAGYEYGAHLRRAGVHAVGSVGLHRDGAGLRILARGFSSLLAAVAPAPAGDGHAGGPRHGEYASQNIRAAWLASGGARPLADPGPCRPRCRAGGLGALHRIRPRSGARGHCGVGSLGAVRHFIPVVVCFGVGHHHAHEDPSSA